MVRIVKNPEERRDEIISAACQLFLSKGYDGTTMQDVMHYLGIAKGTIYHYFKSKEQLLEAVIENLAEQEMERLANIARKSEGNALERLQILIIQGAVHHADNERNQLLDDLHKNSNAGMHIRLLAKAVTKQAPLYAELFQQGCEEGIFQTETPLECAELLLSGIQFLTDIGIYPWSEDQLRRRWQAFPALLESQLGAPQGSFAFLLQAMSQ